MYSGKEFENDFKDSWKEKDHGTSLIRLYDPTFGSKGVSNPCDFILGARQGTYLLELKTVQGTTLGFDLITPYQFSQMLLIANTSPFTHCGILVYFRDPDVIRYYPIQQLDLILKKENRKSVNCITMPEYGYDVKFKRKRVHVTIDTNQFFNRVLELAI